MMRHSIVWQGLSTFPVHIAELVVYHSVAFECFVCEQLNKEKKWVDKTEASAQTMVDPCAGRAVNLDFQFDRSWFQS